LTAYPNKDNIKVLNPCHSFGCDKLTNDGASRYLFFMLIQV
jgi:hypothetical protein